MKVLKARLRSERGAATAEYAVATLAAVGRLRHNWGYDAEDTEIAARSHLRAPIRRRTRGYQASD
ncbi:MAG: DUF4244 domain-containing protein [Leifsonia sp.]|nr:DUF4244 domain-containing protein [Leifsonia sp.]